MRRLLALAPLVLLACCVRPPEPLPAPQPTPVPPPVARPVPLASDWRDWRLTPGTWSYRADPRGSIASFGTAGEDAVATLRCDSGARGLYLSLRGAPPATGGVKATVRTSSETRTITLQPTGGTPPYVAAEFAANDRLLDAMGFSRGRFVIDAPPLAPRVLPAWPEILRVIEDCRG